MFNTKFASRCLKSLKIFTQVRTFANDKLFGSQPFTSEEISVLSERLNMMLGDEVVAKRKGPGGVSLSYIEGWKAIEIANKTFGYLYFLNIIYRFNVWSDKVLDIKTDYMDKIENGMWNCGVTALVRVELKDGCSHEDVGFGEATGSTRGMVLDKAKKVFITILFYNKLGSCYRCKEKSIETFWKCFR